MISHHATHPPTTADERTHQPPFDIRRLDPAQQEQLREIDRETRLQRASMRRLADAAIRATR